MRTFIGLIAALLAWLGAAGTASADPPAARNLGSGNGVTVTASSGGPGGTYHELRCPAQTPFMVGVRARTGLWVDQVTPLCVALAQSGRWASETPLAAPDATAGGGGGQEGDYVCPSGQLVLGIDTLQTWHLDRLTSIGLYCGRPEIGVTGVVRTAYAPDPNESDSGLLSGHPLVIASGDELHCPDGQVEFGLNVKSGDWVDSVAAVCAGMNKLAPPPPVASIGRGRHLLPGGEDSGSQGRSAIAGVFAGPATSSAQPPPAPPPPQAPPAGLQPVSIFAFRQAQGEVLLYRYSGGSAGNPGAWQPGQPVNNSFSGVADILPAGQDGLYAQTSDGSLYFMARTELESPYGARATRVAGFNANSYSLVTGADDGVIYGLTAGGGLDWWRNETLASGGAVWRGPVRVAEGWTGLRRLFAGGGHVVYAMTDDGHILWARHDGAAAGTGAWTSRLQVGSDWAGYAQIFTEGGGVIYAVRPTGELIAIRHRGFTNGVKDWDPPVQVGAGWSGYRDLIAMPGN